ncbi:T9SS type A sorting domain-containing protein [Hymenobacter saemangeumensis]|uniref:T9SS type A sorting domain-containing protein n=1 Tax=Hymenobacter saemangeumensis TaxID=1084522 RepID=UPI0031EA5461
MLLAFSSLAKLQAQALDPAFQPTVLRTIAPVSRQNTPRALLVQPDGKVLTAGSFDFANGTLAGKIQRLNADGSTDASFTSGAGANGFIAALALQADGKIIIGGGFAAYNGVPMQNVARLNANGTLDPTFMPSGISSARQVTSLALQADGKILVGSVTNLGGMTNPGIVRLNPNGTADATFNVGAGATAATGVGIVWSVLVQADGRILVGGSFSSFNGQPANHLVRLNPTGSLDGSFTPGTGPDQSVRALAQQPDGKILIGGAFTNFNGQPAVRLARLMTSGQLDPTFNTATGANQQVLTLLVQANGSVVVGGQFTQYSGQARNGIVRVLSTGTPDAGFNMGVGTNTGASVFSLAQTAAGQVLAAGDFSQFDGNAKTGLVRLTATGANDPVFTFTASERGFINFAAPLANGQLLVSGNFTEFNGVVAPGFDASVRRINANGSLDPTYTTTASSVYGAQPDGTFYALVSTLTGGVQQSALQRILPSGAVDNSFASLLFSAAAPSIAPFQNLTVQPDGRVLVYGNFTSYGNATRNGIVRLNTNGTVDTQFNPPAGTAPRVVVNAVVQPTGKIVIRYTESGTGALPGNLLARLNADGTLDNTFSVGTGAGPNDFFSVLMQPDGKLLLSGGLTSFNGQATPFGAVRLGVNGAIDNTFNGLTDNYSFRVVQPDGRILAIAGNRGTNALVRLNANGSPDNSFAAVAIPLGIFVGDDVSSSFVLQPADNKIIVFGSFRTVAGQTRIGLARLTNPNVSSTRSAAATLPLEVYPNPTRELLTVALPAAATQATLLDLMGRPVRTWTLAARQQEARLDLGSVAPGVYVLRIPTPVGTYQQKVVLAR